MKDDMNSKSIATLDFLSRYGGLEVDINDGRIVDYCYVEKETPGAATPRESW